MGVGSREETLPTLPVALVEPTWAEVKRWSDEQIENYTQKLQNLGLSHIDRESLCVRIDELKELQKLENPGKMRGRRAPR